MTEAAAVFDQAKYKSTTREQWGTAAGACHRWGGLLGSWLGPATEAMYDMADIGPGSRVLDGESLDQLEEGSFDAVVSRVGMTYFLDQQKALAGMKHALRDGGKVAAMVYSTAENNGFFSLPVSIIRRRANLGPPLPGQPGPFRLGGEGVLAEADCLAFEKESFGALHQMLGGLSDAEKSEAWAEIEDALRQFEGPSEFEVPCELIVAVGTR